MKFFQALGSRKNLSPGPGDRPPRPSESGVLDDAVRAGPSETLSGLASETLVMPRREKRPGYAAGDIDAIVEHLERCRKQSRFELSGGPGMLSLRKMAVGLNGRILSDGGTVRVRCEAGRYIVSVEGRPLELGNLGETTAGLKKDVLTVENALRDARGAEPVKISVTESVSSRYLEALAGKLTSLISRAGLDSLKLSLHTERSRELAAALNGRILADGKILRVDGAGELSIAENYNLGANGWSLNSLKRDFKRIQDNARAALSAGVRFKVWLDPQKTAGCPHLNSIRRGFAELRQKFGDVFELYTDSKSVDKIPGFGGTKQHLASFDRGTEPDSMRELNEISRCEAFIASEHFRKPLVVWIKRESLGELAVGYLKSLKRALGTDLKVISPPLFKVNHPRLHAELNGETRGLSGTIKNWWGKFKSFGRASSAAEQHDATLPLAREAQSISR